MTGFMVGGNFAFIFFHEMTFAFWAEHDFFDGFQQFGVANDGFVAAGGQNSGFVHKIHQIGTGEAWRAFGEFFDVDVFFQGFVFGVDGQDGFAVADIWWVEDDAAVKAAWTEEGWVEDIGTVGGGDDDDAEIWFKAVHFYQDLVEGLFTFIVRTAHAGTTLATDGVDFVDKDDTRRVLFGFSE